MFIYLKIIQGKNIYLKHFVTHNLFEIRMHFPIALPFFIMTLQYVSTITTTYLGVSSTEHIDHDLHDSLVHAQYSHQVRVLVEDLVVHNVTKKHMKRSKR